MVVITFMVFITFMGDTTPWSGLYSDLCIQTQSSSNSKYGEEGKFKHKGAPKLKSSSFILFYLPYLFSSRLLGRFGSRQSQLQI